MTLLQRRGLYILITILRQIEVPLLAGASRAMQKVYDHNRASPDWQVTVWIVLMCFFQCFLTYFLLADGVYGSRPVEVGFGVVLLLITVLDGAVARLRIHNQSNHYCVEEYQLALEKRERERRSLVFLRITLLALGVFSLFDIAWDIITDTNTLDVSVGAFFVMGAIRFYLRACEPPKPRQPDGKKPEPKQQLPFVSTRR